MLTLLFIRSILHLENKQTAPLNRTSQGLVHDLAGVSPVCITCRTKGEQSSFALDEMMQTLFPCPAEDSLSSTCHQILVCPGFKLWIDRSVMSCTCGAFFAALISLFLPLCRPDVFAQICCYTETSGTFVILPLIAKSAATVNSSVLHPCSPLFIHNNVIVHKNTRKESFDICCPLADRGKSVERKQATDMLLSGEDTCLNSPQA